MICNFIVKRHTQIDGEQVWQNGVHLQNHDGWHAEALVEADYHARWLSVWVAGPQAARYFAALYDDIKHILGRMDKLPYEEELYLPGTGDMGRVRFKTLLVMEAAGQSQYYCEYGIFNIAELLNIMPTEKRQQQTGVAIHLEGHVENFVYAGGDIHKSRIGSDNVQLHLDVQHQLADLDKALKQPAYDLEVELDDPDLQQAALKELKMLRNAVQALQKEQEPVEAWEKLSSFGDRLQAGGSKLVDALKQLKTGGETLQWLQTHVPAVVVSVAKWLGL